jgi:hypothetical protein
MSHFHDDISIVEALNEPVYDSGSEGKTMHKSSEKTFN